MSKYGDQVQLKNISTMWENGQEKRVSNRPLSSQVSLFTSDFKNMLDHKYVNFYQYTIQKFLYVIVTINFTIWDKKLILKSMKTAS